MTRRPGPPRGAPLRAGDVSGCAGASNSGGDTTCKDYLAASTADQGATVARMLKERNGRNGSTTDVEAKRESLVKICTPAEKQGSDIGSLA